jgi:Ferritin-like domain
LSRAGLTRAEALRAAAAGGAAVGAGALLGGWVAPETSAGRPSPAQDARIWSFLLVLEQAQAAFYDAALRGGALRGELLGFARVVAPQEHDHVALVRRRLGGQARPAPAFDFRAATASEVRFRQAAIDLEEAAAAAYIGQGPSLTRSAVADAARIVAVEARHAAWIRDLAGADPAPRPADPGRTAQDVISELHTKGFLR